MEINIMKDVNQATVEVGGDIDEKGAEQLKEGILELATLKDITFDFKDVKYIGSSGIGKLLLFYKNVAMHEGAIKIINLQTNIYNLFREMKLDTIFTITEK
jgi:anti-anti-sigma factor